MTKTLYKKLKYNKHDILEALGNSSDVIVRDFKIGSPKKTAATIIYLDGLTDSHSVQHFLTELFEFDFSKTNDSNVSLLHNLKDIVLSVGELNEEHNLQTLLSSILAGNVILLVDGYATALNVGLKGWKDRGVTETSSESVIRGPKEAFSENLRTNTSLIRRKIKDPNLWMETRQVGKVTQTDVSLMYINGIVDDKLVKEVRSRLDKIDIDGILEGGYIEELIQDQAFSPFPTIYNTERPDVVAAGLLEGRIAIIVDGTPFVLLAPALFIQLFQAAEDYYSNSIISSALRLLRYGCFSIA